MRWQARYQKEGFGVIQGEKKGRTRKPDHWFDNPPEQPDGTDWIIDAYWDLASDRSPDGDIRWSVARQWFEVRGHREEIWPIFWECIREIDPAYRIAISRVTGGGS